MLSPKPRLTLHQLACCHVPWLSLMYIEMVFWGNWLSYASLSFGLADLEKYLHSKQLRARSLKLLLNLGHKKYWHQFHQQIIGGCANRSGWAHHVLAGWQASYSCCLLAVFDMTSGTSNMPFELSSCVKIIIIIIILIIIIIISSSIIIIVLLVIPYHGSHPHHD